MRITALAASAFLANGQTWTPTSVGSAAWQSVAASADGSTITAVALYAGPRCTSTNGGMTWSTNSLMENGHCVASSSDGKTLIVVSVLNGGIHISTNTGATWNLVTNLPWLSSYRSSRIFDWRSAACSADARTIVVGCIAATAPGQTFVSTNSGADWTMTTVPGGFALAASADGTRLAAGAEQDGFYSSTNSGLQWVKKSGPPGFCWCIASCADGSKLAAAIATNANADAGFIYTSLDGGDTWQPSGAPAASWSSVACSADGSKLVATAYGGGIFTSPDRGATWVSNNAPVAQWISTASSADGAKLFAVVRGGGIWTTQSMPTPLLKAARRNGRLALSWTVPSTPFVLQQNLGFSPDAWEDADVTVALDLTNLDNCVSFPLSPTNIFYRLMSL